MLSSGSIWLWIILVVVVGVVLVGCKDAGKICLFSNMSGVITLDGKPAVNARLVRTVELSSKQVDETTTDKDGSFEFPAVFARSLTKMLPQEFASNQDIVVHYQGKEYRMWSAVKRTTEENSEARGKPLVVKCELNSEEQMIKVNNSPIFSLCTWDVEPDKRRKAF